jgi:hypothetical protein
MNEDAKNPAAVELGKLGGKKTAERGPEYYAEINAKRQNRLGGRPKGPPKAEHEGILKIGDLEIACAVLEDGTRVLSERSVTKSLGGKRGGSHWLRKQAGAELPVYLSANNLKPYVDSDLELALKNPIVYRPKGGGGAANGLRAEFLPRVCDVWLKARAAGVLRFKQENIAAQAEILVRSLAGVAMIALVDEATGYQALRARNALEKILEQFIATEFRKWAKRFPDEFYREMFRLWDWEYKEDTVKRTPLAGKLTKDLVYNRLAPGVVQELERKNPKVERGHRRHKHHQWLTEDVGDPRLREHLASVIALMRASDNREDFIRMLNRSLPRYLPAPLFDGEMIAATKLEPELEPERKPRDYITSTGRRVNRRSESEA